MDEDQIPTGETSNEVTPELAESLPYAELKQRMRAEATAYENSTPNVPTPGGEEADEDATPDAGAADTGTERDEAGRFASRAQQDQGTRTTEKEYKKPETLEEAIRVLDSLRGNLNTAASERATLQKQLQEFQAESARRQQEAERATFEGQHRQILEAIQRLPDQRQRDAALSDYQARLKTLAVNDYEKHLTQQEETLAQRQFEIDKREIPGMYRDIAEFVANQHGVNSKVLLDFVNSDRVANMVKAARKPEALQAVSIVLGETLDEMAFREAARVSAEKEARRKAASGNRLTRDAPAGLTPGNGNEDEVARIQAMKPDEFAAFKKKLLAAAER